MTTPICPYKNRLLLPDYETKFYILIIFIDYSRQYIQNRTNVWQSRASF